MGPKAHNFINGLFSRVLTGLFVSFLGLLGLAQNIHADPNQGPGGPILVITSPDATFGTYYAEILRTEGLNSFAVADISTVDAGFLANYEVAILAGMPLSTDQATTLGNWVNLGGNLIAMDPDPALANLLGLSPAAGTLDNGYVRINNSTRAGSGIVGETMQFHGTAQYFTLAGASSFATLYSDSVTPTAYPAVTLNRFGSGQAAAFAYDLATSIVYTRQGNPAWVGQERDGTGPIRANDLFYGNAASDPQPDWIDLTKVSIPQADEQQRFLANLIIQMNLDQTPLPRFWYFPQDYKAAVLLTGDDHGSSGWVTRFDALAAQSPAGCSLADWTCLRGTVYLYEDNPASNSDAARLAEDGFEVALHLNTSCGNFDVEQLDNYFSSQMGGFANRFGLLVPAPETNRTHCVAWSDWASTAIAGATNYGVRLDTNYYYWPPGWVNDRPGHFTGSAMPMRFADLDGTLIDTFQVVTQMTDESGQSYPFTIDTLLDRALGASEQYGIFTANAHSDGSGDPRGIDIYPEISASAISRGVPLITAKQLLDWLDARNASSFDSLVWGGTSLGFTIAAASLGADGLQAMIPYATTTGVLSTITRDATEPVAFEVTTVKGVDYAKFGALAGAYVANYVPDTVSPGVISTFPASGSNNMALDGSLTATFSEAMDPATINVSTFVLLDSGAGPVSASVRYDAASRTATLDPIGLLLNGETYTATVRGGSTDPRAKDLVGNSLSEDVSWTFTTVAPTIVPNVVGLTQAAAETTITAASLVLGTVTTAYSATVPVGDVISQDPPGGASASSGSAVDLVVSSGDTCPCATWPDTTVPTLPSAADTDPIEVGVKFRSTVGGFVTGVRFYKGAVNTGTHVGKLWSASGDLLATAVFTNESATGWQTVSFDAPVAVLADTIYVASYYAPNGGYAADIGFFETSGVASGPLYLLQDGESGGNGVYSYGAGDVFPVSSTNATNYWVDVVFATSVDPDTSAPVVTSTSPVDGESGVAIFAPITATFNEAIDSATVNSSTFELTDSGGALVAATVSYDAATRTARLTPSSPLELAAVYTATVRGGETDPVIRDVAGNALAADLSWSFTVEETASPLVFTVWPDTTVPTIPSASDPDAIELGVKFRANVDGFVTGVRFYKGAANTGIHVGKLWSSSGALLASATFTNESASGWQQVEFATPVAITANTVYVASYFAPNGGYAANVNYFATTGFTSDPLYLLRDGESGGNGVYAYGAGTEFPTNSTNSTNYWVDLVFATSIGPDTTPPVVLSTDPTDAASGIAANAPVTATFSEPLDPATVTTDTVELRDAAAQIVPASVSYDAAGRRAVLTPSVPLASESIYTATVRGGATDPVIRDVAGNALAADVSWSFTTAVPVNCSANPIVAENCLTGNPASEWDVIGVG